MRTVFALAGLTLLASSLRTTGSRPLAGPTGRRPPGMAAGSIASVNRWTGLPHKHAREIERRQRQSAQ